MRKELKEFIEANESTKHDMTWFLHYAARIRKLLKPFDESETPKTPNLVTGPNQTILEDRRKADRRVIGYTTGKLRAYTQERRMADRRSKFARPDSARPDGINRRLAIDRRKNAPS